ncbi:hypothetical protein [Nannocystis punicea]|uniref:Secreted protein n=1 Tax=Nannocystis punicea TaxID=2995304 RepID=A0ABY7H8L6_9BACT|nr:hypothetical protein [Nannocystis poenicansa]WAS95581.1 hypothetical protein O0S08_05415 [Nannocystis poenicansa]
MVIASLVPVVVVASLVASLVVTSVVGATAPVDVGSPVVELVDVGTAPVVIPCPPVVLPDEPVDVSSPGCPIASKKHPPPNDIAKNAALHPPTRLRASALVLVTMTSAPSDRAHHPVFAPTRPRRPRARAPLSQRAQIRAIFVTVLRPAHLSVRRAAML